MNEEFFSLIPKLKRKCCSVLKVQGTFRKKRIVGVYDDEDPPVPISNTVVKLVGAEDTWLETTRENKTMPTFFFYLWPVSQAAKTSASHAEDRSSILLRVTTFFSEGFLSEF